MVINGSGGQGGWSLRRVRAFRALTPTRTNNATTTGPGRFVTGQRVGLAPILSSFVFRHRRPFVAQETLSRTQHAPRPRYCFHVIVAWPYNTSHMRLPTPKPPAQAPGTASFVPLGCAPPSPSATPSSTMDKPTNLSLYLPTSAIRQTKTYM